MRLIKSQPFFPVANLDYAVLFLLPIGFDVGCLIPVLRSVDPSIGAAEASHHVSLLRARVAGEIGLRPFGVQGEEQRYKSLYRMASDFAWPVYCSDFGDGVLRHWSMDVFNPANYECALTPPIPYLCLELSLRCGDFKAYCRSFSGELDALMPSYRSIVRVVEFVHAAILPIFTCGSLEPMNHIRRMSLLCHWAVKPFKLRSLWSYLWSIAIYPDVLSSQLHGWVREFTLSASCDEERFAIDEGALIVHRLVGPCATTVWSPMVDAFLEGRYAEVTGLTSLLNVAMKRLPL